MRFISLIMAALLATMPCVVEAQTTPGGPVTAPAAPMGAPRGGAAAAAGGADSAAPVLQDYKLGIADQVRLTIYNEPDLSGEFTVNASGLLSLPLIGDVSVLGDTASQVVSKVQQKLADGYLKDPHVSLEILTYRPFYIMGEVNKPGEYPYANGLTVLNAVAAAGGFTYRANKHNVFIRHAGSDKDEKMSIQPGLQIAPGDTIRIGERYF